MDPANPAPVPLAYRPREAARAIGVSIRTLEIWCSNGVGPPCVKIGGGRARLFPVLELQRWLSEKAAQQQAPTATEGGRP